MNLRKIYLNYYSDIWVLVTNFKTSTLKYSLCYDFDEVATKALSTPTNTAELVQLQEDVKKVCFDLYRLKL